MKKILVGFLLFGLFSCASYQSLPVDQLQITKIIDVPNINKNQLYIRVNEWFVNSFNSAESVIEFQDKEAGKIMGKYTFDSFVSLYNYRIKQTISVDIKDGKIRARIFDPYAKVVGSKYGGSYNPASSQAMMNIAKPKWQKLLSDLELQVKKSNDW